MPVYDYPTNVELLEIEKAYINDLNMNDPIFKIFPIRESKNFIVNWRQRDYTTGLMAFRGLNGSPARVAALGMSEFQMKPGVYGEFAAIDETEMKVRSANRSLGDRINISDLVMERKDQLRGRRIDRIRKILWDMVTLGYFSVLGPTGAIVHADSWNQRIVTAGSAYSNLATGTPFADFLSLPILARGYAVNFGSGAEVYGNIQTVNNIVANTNPADFGGKKRLNGSTINSLDDVNTIFSNQGLPTLKVWDAGYFDDLTKTYQLFIPNNTLVVIGKRIDGATVGRFTMTTGVDGQSSLYSKVINKTGPNDEPPPTIHVHEGFDGGPELHHPAAILRIAC